MGLDMTGAGAAGLSALGNIGSSLFGAFYNANQSKINRNFQREMYERQYKDALDFWKLQQDFNSPSNQLNRLLSAGLNPLLMYGEGGVTNVANSAAQTPSQPSGAQASYSFTNPFETAQYLLIDAQRQKLTAEADKVKSETDWQKIENQYSRDTLNVRRLLAYGEYDKVRAIVRDYNDQIFQRGFINTQQAATMAQARIYEIKRFNLTEHQITTSLEQSWYDLRSGRIAANAQLRNASANWLNAITNHNEAKWRIGAMAQDIYYKAQNQPYILNNLNLQNELNRYDLGIKANEIVKGYNYNQVYRGSQGANDIPMWIAPFFIWSNAKTENPMNLK